MTDTPETDQAERESIAAYIEAYGPDAVFPCDGYDHARKLERERDVWKHNAKIVDEERKAEHENAIDMFINLHELRHAVKTLRDAKGRFHTEQAATNLFNLLP